VIGFSNPAFNSLISADVVTLSTISSNSAIQRTAVQCLVFFGKLTNIPATFGVKVFNITEGVGLASTISNNPFITFPQEELLFGRDVVINAIYLSMNANAPTQTDISFYINNVLFATYIFDPAFWNTLSGNPIEVAVYPTSVGVFTAHSPQLTIRAESSNGATIRISKIQLYGSMEPEQRPVS
jgi:hypothetical protein